MENFFLRLAVNPYFAACAGLSLGAGIIIIFLSKYGTRVFFPGGTSLEANALARMEKKIDSVDAKTENWMQSHLTCRQWQMDNFVTNKTFQDWTMGREPIWRRLNRHAHDEKTGKVIITED